MVSEFIGEDGDVGNEIYEMIKRYAGTDKFLPNPYKLWKKVIVEKYGYAVSRGCFDYHWMRFRLAGKVIIDPLTKAYRIADVDFVVKNF